MALPFLQVYYTSIPDPSLTLSNVVEMVERARAANRQNEVTGALLSTRTHFLQFLEGPPEATETLLEKIVRDNRHNSIVLSKTQSATERLFPDWAMPYMMVEVEDQFVRLVRSSTRRMSHEKVAAMIHKLSARHDLTRPPRASGQ